SEPAKESNANIAPTANGRRKLRGFLVYDPDHTPSVSECSVGLTIRYGDCDGTITRVLDDAFCPKIKVIFPGHPHPLMRELLLMVSRGKRKAPRSVGS